MSSKIVIFDAYGTLLDVNAAAREVASDPEFPQIEALWQRLSTDWRAKQLEYSWLRTITGDHVDFWQITQDALDWALQAQGLDDETLRARLLALYHDLPPYREALACLETLRSRGLRCGVLSNGSPEMLAAAFEASKLTPFLDAILSVEAAGVYKPSRRVYDLVERNFATARQEVLFVSSNGWDAAGAAAYGFRTIWVNRGNAPMDRLSGTPDHIVEDLSHVAEHA